MHLSENTKSNRSLWRNEERALLDNPNCKPDIGKNTSWTTVDQAKDIASSTNPHVKALCRNRHWVWGPTRRRAIKEWSIAINRGWVNNWARSLPRNIWIISYCFNTVNKLSELFRKIRFPLIFFFFFFFFLFCKLNHYKVLVPICLVAEFSSS